MGLKNKLLTGTIALTGLATTLYAYDDHKRDTVLAYELYVQSNVALSDLKDKISIEVRRPKEQDESAILNDLLEKEQTILRERNIYLQDSELAPRIQRGDKRALMAICGTILGLGSLVIGGAYERLQKPGYKPTEIY